MCNKKNILILNGQYLPGYKGGGPIQSCVNMIENLHDTFDFYVLCADRDLNDTKPYDDIKINEWNTVGNAQVYYMSPKSQTLKGFKKILEDFDYDVLYLNGFFSPIFTIKPLILIKLGLFKNRNIKVILTPRGDFTGGCENKKIKKYSFIYISKLIRLYSNILWQATSKIEEKDIKNKFKGAKIICIPNLPQKYIIKKDIKKKMKGKLDLVFISRIFPKKNLKYALEVLKEVKNGEITFDIYGPLEDKNYWNECSEIISILPKNIHVKYCGEVKHENIASTFQKYHAFLFPTLGENYGHVIVEAMTNNCLCILSKHVTPWDNYINRIGLGADLKDKTKFIRDIENLIEFNQEQMSQKLNENNDYISNINAESINDNLKKYKNLFENEVK